MGAAGLLRMLVHIYQTTQCHIPQDVIFKSMVTHETNPNDSEISGRCVTNVCQSAARLCVKNKVMVECNNTRNLQCMHMLTDASLGETILLLVLLAFISYLTAKYYEI